MPIYEYECKSCCLRFELNRQFGQNSGTSCPRCQSEARRIFSPVPIVFKGTGFYVTDKATKDRGSLIGRSGGEKPGNNHHNGAGAGDGKEEIDA